MTWDEVAVGVFRRRYRSFDLNCGVVLGSGACLLVDTRSHLGEAAELRADLRRLTSLPLAAVVNTHAHFDHCYGNAAFGEAPLWGQRGCADLLRRHGEQQTERIAAQLRASGEDRFAAEVERAPIVAPERLVDREVAIDVGGRTVRLRYLGRGHTDHDLVVEVPDAGVIFAGDLVEQGADPVMGDAWPLEWPETLRRLGALVEGTVVPGHGDVVDAAFVTGQRDELAALADLARRVAVGEIDEAAAVKGSPLAPDTTRVALARVRFPDADPRDQVLASGS